MKMGIFKSVMNLHKFLPAFGDTHNAPAEINNQVKTQQTWPQKLHSNLKQSADTYSEP